MLGYGGLNRAEGRVTRISHEWETLRAAHRRGELPTPVLLDRLTQMCDELAGVAASSPHPSLVRARQAAADLGHRIRLHTVALAPQPVVIPGVTGPVPGAPVAGHPVAGHPVRDLPELWHHHRHDPERCPAHPDAVGAPGTDGSPLDGEGGRLPDLFRLHWQDAAVAAVADPGVSLAEIDAVTDRTAEVIRHYGGSTSEVAAVRARVLLATGRVEQARELLDLTGEQARGTAVTRAGVALLRGDLDTLMRLLGHAEDTGRAGTTEWTLVSAASLVPLAHVVDAATTVDRVAAVVAASAGVPEMVPAMLHVIEYLALAGQPEAALSLLVRTVDPAKVPASAAPALQAVVHGGWSSDPASDLGHRRLVEGGETVHETAERLAGELRADAAGFDARDGRRMWTTLVPAVKEYPVPPLTTDDLAGISGLRGLALPAALLPDAVCTVTGQGTAVPAHRRTELPGVGPVDPESFDASESLCATVMYTLLGLTDAADLVVDRMRCLTPADGDTAVLDVAGEFVRRADLAAGATGGRGDGREDGREGARANCAGCPRMTAPASVGLLKQVDSMVRDCACAGSAHDAPSRVRAMVARRSGVHPLVRRLIDLDILLAGTLPTRDAVECAVQGLWAATRLLPRAVPLTGGALLGSVTDPAYGRPGRGIVDATVISTVTAVARTLPAPPPASPLGLVDHVADLADLAEALVQAGAHHEACSVAGSGLSAVGENWAGAGLTPVCGTAEAGADDDGPVRLLRAGAAALAYLGNATTAATFADAAAGAAEYRGRWRLAEACREDAAARRA